MQNINGQAGNMTPSNSRAKKQAVLNMSQVANKSLDRGCSNGNTTNNYKTK
jgi:hypothetical protein